MRRIDRTCAMLVTPIRRLVLDNAFDLRATVD